ncbi:hypothetical protein [Kribbella sp. CA-293567]|uniref:hypothetical protein n=1 Tax=Kribbella sp. CA-293567 TaxID=3002436 RepID=UPI0022DD4AE3|nr:hypothetical protein [Kribbella sp. CA-293567]WBQ03037.1 hypothetical protein OX958_24005 [Kribbella sp. CA-293567]
MTPTIGRIVHYTITADEAKQINNRRRDADAHSASKRHTGYVTHAGNEAEAGQTFPLLITRVWGDEPGAAVNGQIFLDGNDTLWVTSATEGDGERHYQWPQRTNS